MLKKITMLLLTAAAFLPARAQFSNVPVTGFNADIVADGAVGAATASTTASADLAVPPYVFVSTTFNPGSGICATGATALPASGTITSTNTTNNTNITYVLQSYGNGTATNNNVLQLAANATGTLTLVTPISAAKLYLVCLGGSGASSYTAVVNFSDATSQTITNAPAAPDWCGGASTYRLTSQSYYRINNNSTTCNGGTCQYLYEIPVTLAGSNFNKLITSVTLTNTTSGTLLNVFAVGAQAPCTPPTAQPTGLTLTPTSTSQIGGSFTAASGSPAGYLVVRYPQGATVTPPASGTTYTAGQTLGLGTVVLAGTGTTFSDAGLSGSTTYSYYVYSYSNSTSCGGPVYLLTSPLTANQTTLSCGTMSGVIPVGPGLPNTPAGGFTSLTQALAYINTNGLGGNTVLELQSGYVGTTPNETFPITFPSNPCVSASRKLVIRPAAGVTGLTISNTSDGAPVIDFNGATYVKIDGVNYGLTISNTSTVTTAATSTIRFINDANQDTVANCIILGSATGTLSSATGVVLFSTAATNGNGNDNNTIIGNKIGPAGTNLPSKCISGVGTTSSANIANSNINILNNEVYDYFLPGGDHAGIYATTGNTAWNVQNNKVYQTGTRTFTSGVTAYGIYFSNTTYGAQVKINNNTIGYASGTGTGTLTYTGSSGAFQGIYFNMLSSDTNTCTINNNLVSDISLTSSSGSLYGIQNASSTGSNTITINNNTIRNITDSTSTGSFYGIAWTSGMNIFITGNSLYNLRRTGAGTFYGIYSGSSSTNETISNNTIYNFSSTASGSSTIAGIYQNTASGTKAIQNNQVYNFTGNGGTTMYGIRIGYGTTIDISSNTIYALNSTGGTGGSVYGISTGTQGTAYTVYKNKVYNLSMSSSGGTVYGIYNNSSATNIYNNLVGDISSTAFTASSAPYLGASGIYISSGNANIYNNTIRIGNVTSSGANFSAAGIYTSTSPNVLMQNNLVVNLATPTGSGKAVGYMRSDATLSTFNTASGTNSYYCGTPGASNVIFWDNTNAYQTLAAYQTAMAPREQFAISANPTFSSTTGSATNYLHIPAGGSNPLESAGTNVAAFNTDYDGDARPGPAGSVNGGGLLYDIGADEFDGVPMFTCTTPAPGNTIASAVCYGNPVTLSLQNATPGNAVTYQWYSSTNGGSTYAPINNATGATYATIITGPTYFKCTVACGGTLSATSNPVLVNYTNNVTGTTPATRCGTGTVNLTAAVTSGTPTWYTSATGGVSVGTGSPFTTPTLSATTTYYVDAETASGVSATIGTGTGTNSSSTSVAAAYPSYYGNGRQQYLILASELQSAGLSYGNLTSISFNVTSIGSPATLNGYTIKLAPTTATSITTFQNPAFTTVWGSTNYTPTVGVNTHTFTAPFPWDGSSNILVDICFSNQVTGSTSTQTTQTNSNFNSSINYQADGSGGAGACTSTSVSNTSTYRPNMVFAGQAICTGPRVPVTATVNPAPAFTITPSQTACNNGITTLTVTSNNASYTNYTWSPATNLYTNATATTAYTAGSNASTVYMKSNTAGQAIYTANANNSSTLCAAVTADTIIVLPASAVAIATPGALCMSGTAGLTLVPATGYGAAQFQWQSSMNNTTFVDTNGTAPTYTTPTLTSTRYYRATIKNSSGAVCFNSTPDTVRVYNPVVTGTTPATRCGPGTLTLGATGTDGTLYWYTAATGGNSVGSGTSFTTPSISNTTTYYAAVQSSLIVNAVVGTASTTLGTSTGDNGLTPLSQYYEGAHTQYLLLASDLLSSGLAAGNLTSLSFNVTTKNSTLPYSGYMVKVATTTATSLSGIVTPTFNTVYGPSSYSSVVGANTFNFAAPVYWDGSANLIVDVCFANDPGSTGIFYTNNDIVSATTKSYTATYGLYQDNSSLCGATTATSTANSQIIPVITFTKSCESPRQAVIATVNPLPTITVTPNGTQQICQGSNITLTATGGGNYQWKNAAGNINGQTNSTFTTGTAGAYKVVVTTPATGCTDSSAAVTVNVVPSPTVNLGNDTTFCSGPTLTLNAGNPGASFLWDNNSTNQTRNVTSTGTYYVRVTNSTGCIKRDTINVTVNPTPVVNLGNDTNLCAGTNFVLNAGNPGAAHLWDNNSTGQTRTVTNSGTYYVKVTNSFNCTARDTIVTTYYPYPVVNLGNDIDACVGQTVTLDAGNPAQNYLWDDGSTQQTRSVTATGNYHVTVSNIANCKAADTIHVTFHPLPIVNLGNDTVFCYGNTLVLNAGNPGAAYLWNDNTTNQTLPVSTSGTYSVVVTDMYSCVGSDAINILVKDPPSGHINAVHSDTATYFFNVLDPQYVTSYTWNFGDGSPLATGPNVSHRYASNAIYTVSVLLGGECSDSTTQSRTVDVYDVPGGTGIPQIKDSKDLLLYPNPAKDIVTIENKANLKLKQVVVYNVIGQVIVDAPADSENKHKLNTAGYASGIYTVRIETDKGYVIRKFEIMK